MIEFERRYKFKKSRVLWTLLVFLILVLYVNYFAISTLLSPDESLTIRGFLALLSIPLFLWLATSFLAFIKKNKNDYFLLSEDSLELVSGGKHYKVKYDDIVDIRQKSKLLYKEIQVKTKESVIFIQNLGYSVDLKYLASTIENYKAH